MLTEKEPSNLTDFPVKNWLDRCLAWSLQQRVVVLVLAGILLVWGYYAIEKMDIDVLPDLTAPTVAVMTEAHGLNPTEMEKLVTLPLERALNGSTGVRRLRSSTVYGFSIVWIEFDWGTDVYRARQIVTEKLQLVSSQLPVQADKPVLAPISSIMGEIVFIAMHSKKHSSLKLRTVADQQVRRRLLAIPGVAQVVPIGGFVKQYQVLLRPKILRAYSLTPEDVVKALQKSNTNQSGGWLVTKHQEFAIEGIGRLKSLEEIRKLPIHVHKDVPVFLEQVAFVQTGNSFSRGIGSFNGKSAVVLGLLKQPSANTVVLTKEIERVLDELQKSVPKGILIARKGFRQAKFIHLAIHNVQKAMLEGALFVVVVLLLFLLHFRATFISAITIPFSVLTALLVLQLLGITINTMTLGGITVAIGALVDDAVIDVENIFRHLRLNQELPTIERQSPLLVVFHASREIRSSILFATLILMLVFLPLFFLTGMEGRLLHPLGLAYLVSIFASLLVALTITPVLSYYLLAKNTDSIAEKESFLVVFLKKAYEPFLKWSIRFSWILLSFSGLLLLSALAFLPFVGRSFLPPFNEGSLTIAVDTLPGTSLEKSAELGLLVEKALLRFPEVQNTMRRTGRAELAEHTQEVTTSEIEVVLKMQKRSMPDFLKQLRHDFSSIPGVLINIGQPISHRIDHMLSGVRAAIAIKLFGDDFSTLVKLGKKISSTVKEIEGTTDVAVEPLVQVPKYQILPRPSALARFGLSAGALMKKVNLALWGVDSTHILEGRQWVPVRVKYKIPKISNQKQLESLPVMLTPKITLPLVQLARIHYSWGPNQINREASQRRIFISANSSQTDLIGLVQKIKIQLDKIELPKGYYIHLGGQFERESSARKTLLTLGFFVLFATFFLLRIAFQSTSSALLILANLPLALIGGIFSVVLAGQVISIASIVGFIALFGVATRNGIILISHFQTLQGNQTFVTLQQVIQGSLERLNPILMTALTTGLGMIPLLLAGGQPGNELQSPMALVILGGIFSATLLNLLVLPVLYYQIHREPKNKN